MALELSLDYRLRWLDFDQYGRIQPTSVLDILQDVATLQAEQMGIGREDMLARGVFWVIVRMKYEIVRQPEHYQVVTARTWPHTPTRFSFLRDFHITGVDGELLIKATSEWVLMDAAERKFARMQDHYDGPTDFVEERCFQAKPRKIADFDEAGVEPFTVTPAYSDIDVNGHVNNARYPTFAINALDLGEQGNVTTFQIDYRHEVLPGEPLRVFTKTEGKTALAKGMRPDGACAFACKIELE